MTSDQLQFLGTATSSRSGIVNNSVNLYLWTPETMQDVLIGCQMSKLEPTPAMQANAAQQPQNAARFVLSVGPKSCHLDGKFAIA